MQCLTSPVCRAYLTLALLAFGLLIGLFIPSTQSTPESAARNNLGIERIAFLPTPHGWPVNLVARGNHVLLSNGETFRGLQNIDWSKPDRPGLDQSFDTGNTNAAMVMLGNRVYVLANYHGITMFEMGENDKLTRLGRWRLPPPVDHGRQMVGMQIDGHQYLYLYIKPEGSWKDWPAHPSFPEAGLYLLDVSNAPDVQIKNLGQQPMFNGIYDSYGYVMHGKKLDIYALDRPASPRRISSYEAAGRITGISIDDGHAWLSVDGSSLELLDVNDTYTPRLLARSNDGGMRQAASLAAQGEWAYVLESGRGYGGNDRGLHVFRWHGGKLLHLRHARWPNSNMQRITLAGEAAYVTDWFYGVWRLDIRKPDNPQRGALFMSAGENQQLLLDGNLALLNLEWGGTVGIYDVSDPRHIRVKGYYRPGHFDDYAVGISAPYFYYGKHATRRIIDVRNPSSPLDAGEWKLPGQPLIPPLSWNRTFFEWLYGKEKIRMAAYDMTDPLHPREAGGLDIPPRFAARFGAAATDGRRMYAVADNAILALDVSDLSNIRIIGNLDEQDIGKSARYSWQGSGRRAVLNGDTLYVIQGSEKLDTPRIAVIDVSNPAHMRRVYTTPETPPAFQDDWFDERILHQGDMLNDMVFRGNRLFVSDYWGGVRIYDCSNPFRPQLTHWEFQPYLSLLSPDWSREQYRRAISSDDLHKALGLDATTWKTRHAIGRHIWSEPLEYHPGYDLFGWNIGGFVGDYLLQPKLGGIAVYQVPSARKR